MKEERIKGKRYYYIVRCDLGFQIYRYRENENWTTNMERLQRNSYTLNKDHARVFYHLDDATAALSLAKTKWDKRTSTISIRKSGIEDGGGKKLWSE